MLSSGWFFTWFRQLDLAHFDIFIWPIPKPVFQYDPCSRIDASGFLKTSCQSVLPKKSGLPVEVETEGARRATGVSTSTGWVNVKSLEGGNCPRDQKYDRRANTVLPFENLPERVQTPMGSLRSNPG